MIGFLGKAIGAALLALLPGTAGAQTLITPDEFLDFAHGKTLTFNLSGTDVQIGIEQFLTRSLSVWRPVGRDCVYGRITVEQNQLCFRYEDYEFPGPHCWYVFRKDDSFLVRTARLQNPQVQEIVNATKVPLSCPNPAPSS